MSPHTLVAKTPADRRFRMERRDHPARETLRARVRAEFHDVRGLSLTPPQAAQLLGIDEEICARVLLELAAARCITRAEDGAYVQLDDAEDEKDVTAEDGTLLSGTSDDLRTVERLFLNLRPACPRCRTGRPVPLSWGDAGIWFQCQTCYKFWLQRLGNWEGHGDDRGAVTRT